MNNRKRDYQDVLDPFEIECGWFVLDFPSLQVLPGADVGPTLAVQVQATICRLGLNDESTVKDRLSWLKQFLAHHDLPLLREFAPFIAHELERQGVTEAIDEIMGENLGSLD